MFWNHLLVGIGQLLVCLIFGEWFRSIRFLADFIRGRFDSWEKMGVDGSLDIWLGAFRQLLPSRLEGLRFKSAFSEWR